MSQPVNLVPQSVLGIDISKLYFDVTLIKASKTDTVMQHRFDNTAEGFKQLKRWLKDNHVKHVHACLEATGRYGDA